MFTGLIAGQGELVHYNKNTQDIRLGIKPYFEFNCPVIGESVAINGVCLTVEEAKSDILSFYASAETLSCSNIGQLKLKDMVNMERALSLGDRLGGHLVSGHVDCVGELIQINKVENSTCFRISFPENLAPYIINKGSVALDGISLTVNACDINFLEVNIIPETMKVTTISKWKLGQMINIETDMLGKYILRSQEIMQNSKAKSRIDVQFLSEHGFL